MEFLVMDAQQAWPQIEIGQSIQVLLNGGTQVEGQVEGFDSDWLQVRSGDGLLALARAHILAIAWRVLCRRRVVANERRVLPMQPYRRRASSPNYPMKKPCAKPPTPFWMASRARNCGRFPV